MNLLASLLRFHALDSLEHMWVEVSSVSRLELGHFPVISGDVAAA